MIRNSRFRIRLGTKIINVEEKDIAGFAIYGQVSSESQIVIIPSMNSAGTQDELNTWLHEGSHICNPELTEKEINRQATFLAVLLWAAGYRRVKKKETKAKSKSKKANKKKK
jgi:hypothetical protein